MGWIIFGSIVGLIVNIILAGAFSGFAEDKGHEPRAYFWTCFFLGIIGYCMVAALPDLILREKLEKLVPGEYSKKSKSKKKSKATPQTEDNAADAIQQNLSKNMNTDPDEFIKMINETPTDDLRVIIEDQQELYSETELNIIKEILSKRTTV